MEGVAEIGNMIQEEVCREVEVVKDGPTRYRIFVPFYWRDGDGFAITMKKGHGGQWYFTDEGDTFMVLSTSLSRRQMRNGNRGEVISGTISRFGLKNMDGELRKYIPSVEGAGFAFFQYLQAVTRISDIDMLSQERVKSTFREDLKNFVAEIVPSQSTRFDWHDEQNDERGIYTVDARIDSAPSVRRPPLFLFGLNSDTHTRDATITLHKFISWGEPFESMGVYESSEKIGGDVMDRFNDVCHDIFSNLPSNRDRIQERILHRTGWGTRL